MKNNYIGQLFNIFDSQKYCSSLIHKLLNFTCSGPCSHFLIYPHTFLQWFQVKRGSQGTLPHKVYKFVCFAHWSHSDAETWVANISIDLLGVHSWRHSVLTLGCILGKPSNATSSANANTVVHCYVLFKRAFHFGFLPSKPLLFL